MAERSKLPWRTSEIGLRMTIRADDLTIVATRHRLERRTHEENFEYIVKACNAFPEMDRLLAAAADVLNNSPRMEAMDLGNKITQFRRRMASDVGGVGRD